MTNAQQAESNSQFTWEDTRLFRAALALHRWTQEAPLRPGAKPYVPKALRSSWRALEAIVSAGTMQDRYSAVYFRDARRHFAVCALNILLSEIAGALTCEEAQRGRQLVLLAIDEIPEAPFEEQEQEGDEAHKGSGIATIEDEQQPEAPDASNGAQAQHAGALVPAESGGVEGLSASTGAEAAITVAKMLASRSPRKRLQRRSKRRRRNE